jgi:hypothetical protein
MAPAVIIFTATGSLTHIKGKKSTKRVPFGPLAMSTIEEFVGQAARSTGISQNHLVVFAPSSSAQFIVEGDDVEEGYVMADPGMVRIHTTIKPPVHFLMCLVLAQATCGTLPWDIRELYAYIQNIHSGQRDTDAYEAPLHLEYIVSSHYFPIAYYGLVVIICDWVACTSAS